MNNLSLILILERNKGFDSNCKELLNELKENKDCLFYSKNGFSDGFKLTENIQYNPKNSYLITIKDEKNSNTPITLVKINQKGVYFNPTYEEDIPLESKELLEGHLKAYQELQKSSS